jgi:hypothetical protein
VEGGGARVGGDLGGAPVVKDARGDGRALDAGGAPSVSPTSRQRDTSILPWAETGGGPAPEPVRSSGPPPAAGAGPLFAHCSPAVSDAACGNMGQFAGVPWTEACMEREVSDTGLPPPGPAPQAPSCCCWEASAAGVRPWAAVR